jgi:hypothetical protein
LSRKTCAELRGDQLNDNNELVNERFIFPNALCFCEYAAKIAHLLFKRTRAAVTSGRISAHDAKENQAPGAS